MKRTSRVKFGDLYLLPSRNGINRPSAVRGTGYKMINMGEIFKYDRLHNIEMERVLLNEKEKENFGIKAFDLIFARQSIVAEGAGKCSIVMSVKETTCFESHIIRVRLDENKAHAMFFYYFFQSEIGKGFLSSIRQQGVQAGIRASDLEKLMLPYISIKRQRKIASFLSKYDDLIENNLKRIKMLEEVAQRIYEEWFVKFRVNGEQLKVGDNGLPEGWESIKIDQLLDKVQPSAKTLSTEICSVGKYPVIDQSRDFIAGYIDNEERLVKSERPVIVFGDHTRILKFVNFPFVRGADGTQVILSKEERMPQHLFYHALLRVDLSNYHYARHFKFLKDCEVVVPSLNVAQMFETIVKPNFDMIRNLRDQNRLLKESRDILLPRLMSGKIAVDGDEVLGMVAEERVNYE